MWLTKRGQKRISKNCFSQPKDLMAKKERTEMILKVLSSYLYHLFETLGKKFLEINQELSYFTLPSRYFPFIYQHYILFEKTINLK